MIPEWAESFLGVEEPAEMDPVAGEPVSWGRRVVTQMSEEQFTELRGRCDVVCFFPDWYVVTKRLQFSDLLMAHGPVRAVGVGPGGGFKWVRFDDGSTWGCTSLAIGARRELSMSPRLRVKCDPDGKEAGAEPRIPRRAMGRPSGRHGR
jgi:hypothetical protein